ncbi:MAG: hypothetical protein ABSG90_11480 [Dehalococcoidia bacterium]|jgi:hypothetical protein
MSRRLAYGPRYLGGAQTCAARDAAASGVGIFDAPGSCRATFQALKYWAASRILKQSLRAAPVR